MLEISGQRRILFAPRRHALGRSLLHVRELARRALDWGDSQLNSRTVWLTTVAVIIALQAVLIMTHRPWLDEWQALQISVQSPDVAALFENLRYEGHPPLWYFMLQGAANVLPLAWVLPAVELPIGLGVLCLILFRLPLSRLERLLFALNFYVVLDYGIISRSLSLGVLLFMAALAFRKHRLAWIAVALLPLADFLFGVLSLVCLAVYWRERRLWWPGVAAWLACALFAAWSVRPPPDLVPAISPTFWVADLLVTMARFGSVLFPLQLKDWQLAWDADLPLFPGAQLGAIFLYMGWKLQPDKFDRIVFATFCFFVLIFSVAVYPLPPRHISLAGLLLVMLVALQREHGCKRSSYFVGWLAAGALLGLASALICLIKPFDTAAETAKFIETHGLASKHWAVFPDSRAQGVSALTGIEFEPLERNCMQSFVRWNYRSRISTAYWYFEHELEKIGWRGGYYLLTDSPLPWRKLDHPENFKFVTRIPAGFDGQIYFIYEVRPNVPNQTMKPRECVPDKVPMPPVAR